MKKNRNLLAILLFVTAMSAFAATDWVAPRDSDRYDWRNTTWYGVSGGTITGPGIGMQHWGNANGFRLTVLPLLELDDDYPNRGFLLGGAYLHSINQPGPVPANSSGFTSNHVFWFIGGFGAAGNDDSRFIYGGSVSGGLGVDFNRRDSRWTIMLGLGPYYMQEGSDLFLRIYPSLEISWHFGTPKRLSP